MIMIVVVVIIIIIIIIIVLLLLLMMKKFSTLFKLLERKGSIELSLCYRSDQESLKIGVATVRSLCDVNLDGRCHLILRCSTN